MTDPRPDRPLPTLTTARALRLAARMTQAETARRAGISRHALSVAERAPELMTENLAAKLAPVLGVEPSALLARPAH